MIRIITYSVFIMAFSVYGQENKIVVDSSAIAFKAKMLTISEYGIASKEDVIMYAEDQKLTFLKSVYTNFLFMKIEFGQPYTYSNGGSKTLLRNCNYYLAYNIIDCRYYRLGGFSVIDIDDFFKDLGLREEGYWIKDLYMEHIEEIDIFCLDEYQSWSKKKRDKKGFPCFPDCSKELDLPYIEY